MTGKYADEPTKFFRKAFMGCGSGSPTLRCDCGRVLFSDSSYYEPGELEQLQQKALKDPGKYIHLDGDAVVSYEIFGRSYVDGCPCAYAAHFERVLWHNREQTKKYITERARSVVESMKPLIEE